MAAIPEAMEGMRLSQHFSGAAHQLQADMDVLKLSLETLDFGKCTQATFAYGQALLQEPDRLLYVSACDVS